MKKPAILILALLLCVATFASCGILDNIEVTGTSEISADSKEDSLSLLNGYFEDSLKNANVVATATGDGEVIYVESLLGNKSFLDYQSTGTKMYCFVDGDKYIVATSSEESGFYTTDRKTYDNNCPYFMNNIKILEMVPEEGTTFTCTVKTEEKNKESTSTLTFEVAANGASIKITATAKNGMVQTVTFTNADATSETPRTTELAFAYGNASVTLPDISDWTNMDGWNDDQPEGEETEE
ncbi:MAG: hypothetical protein E7680_06225 [Ruminococcaceae bacterium]|nr:hypothetical protein [Oscillospiraceae bacterium]